MRPSAAERICFACAPRATRILNSRSRLLTVYEARPKVPAIESSSPKAPKIPRATVATWDTKNVSPSWFFQGLDSRIGTAGSRSWINLRVTMWLHGKEGNSRAKALWMQLYENNRLAGSRRRIESEIGVRFHRRVSVNEQGRRRRRPPVPSFAWNGIPEHSAVHALRPKPPLPGSYPAISSAHPFTLYWGELR
jgi:hypothetical protein